MTRSDAPIAVHALDEAHRHAAAALLRQLRVSLFGVQSDRLHAAVIGDALKHRLDCRIAIIDHNVCGVVMAAPRRYWHSAPLHHVGLALDCLRARVSSSRRAHGTGDPAAASAPPDHVELESGPPPLTWARPGDAWRIIVVGTAPEARGLGVAATLYRSVMRERSLVARIAADNHASIRLHRSVGWRLYGDGGVVLAVHVRGGS